MPTHIPEVVVPMPGRTTEFVRKFANELATAWPCSEHRLTVDEFYMGVRLTVVDISQDCGLYTVALEATVPTEEELEAAA